MENARAAADTVKRVSQELGGKSANILLPDVDFQTAVTKGVAGVFNNSGQSCNAPTRMFVPAARSAEVNAIAKEAAGRFTVGDPQNEANKLGPVVSKVQFDKIQRLIQPGIDEGAEVLIGGYYVRPTVFAGVTPEMRIAREEIFGPVLSILTYDSGRVPRNQGGDWLRGRLGRFPKDGCPLAGPGQRPGLIPPARRSGNRSRTPGRPV
jgi:aldehyde dehydrogenase (NAD+)